MSARASNEEAAARRKELLGVAQRLTASLLAFRAPDSNEPVAPALVAPLIRYLQSQPTAEDLQSFVKLMPGSYLGDISRGARPRVAEVARQVTQTLRGLRGPDELLFVLGWTRRLLSTSDERRRDGERSPEPFGERSPGPARPAEARFPRGGRGGGGAPR